jgi:hypothetical protein
MKYRWENNKNKFIEDEQNANLSWLQFIGTSLSCYIDLQSFESIENHFFKM